MRAAVSAIGGGIPLGWSTLAAGVTDVPAPVIVHHKYTNRVPLSLYPAESQLT